MNRIERLIDKVETAWGAFHAAYADLPDEMLLISGVCGDWSIRDLIAHVTWWDAEALKHLPLVLAGGRPPRYADVYGGIDAFNALKTEEKRALSLEDVRREAVDTHARLIAYLTSIQPDTLKGKTPGSPIAFVSIPTVTIPSTRPTSAIGGRTMASDAASG